MTIRMSCSGLRTIAYVLVGVALLAGCDNSTTPAAPGTFAPGTSPSGGGPVFSGGGASQVRIGAQRSASYTVFPPQAALNNRNTAIVAWQEDFQSASEIWTALYDNGAWAPATALNNGDAVDPRVAIDPQGNAVLVWAREDFDTTHATIIAKTVWARRRSSGTWGTPVRISDAPVTDNTFYAFSPAVAIDPNGNCLAVWTQDDPATATPARSTFASYFNGSAWSAPQLISSGTRATHAARAAVDANGNFIVVWTEDTNLPGATINANPNVWERRFGAGVWAGAQMIGPAALAADDGASHVFIAMNTGGDAIVVWEQTIKAEASVAGNVYHAATNRWDGAVTLDTATTPADQPAAAIDDTGNIVTVWRQSDGAFYNAWGRRFDASTTLWDTPALLEASAFDVHDVRVDMDLAGDALVVWDQVSFSGQNAGLWARRFVSASGWESSAVQIGSGQNTALDVNSGGIALVVADRVTSGTTTVFTSPWALVYQP